jgi:microcystin-dependent protein
MPLNDNLPIGSVIIWAGDPNELPSSWKVCNGKELLKTDYATLYGILGTYWNNDKGDQTNFFRIPDLRGVFLRGVNDGRTGNYSDKDSKNRFRLNGSQDLTLNSPGSFQQEAIAKHSHQIVQQSWGGVYTTPQGISGNTSDKDGNFDSSQLSTGIDRNNVPLVIAEFGGEETHPVNAYVYFVIKVKQDL